MSYEHVFDDGFLEILKTNDNYEINGKLINMKRSIGVLLTYILNKKEK